MVPCVRWCLTAVLICFALMTNEAEHFSGALRYLSNFFGEMSMQVRQPLFTGDLGGCCCVPYTLWRLNLSQICDLQMFSAVLWFVLPLC